MTKDNPLIEKESTKLIGEVVRYMAAKRQNPKIEQREDLEEILRKTKEASGKDTVSVKDIRDITLKVSAEKLEAEKLKENARSEVTKDLSGRASKEKIVETLSDNPKEKGVDKVLKEYKEHPHNNRGWFARLKHYFNDDKRIESEGKLNEALLESMSKNLSPEVNTDILAKANNLTAEGVQSLINLKTRHLTDSQAKNASTEKTTTPTMQAVSPDSVRQPPVGVGQNNTKGQGNTK